MAFKFVLPESAPLIESAESGQTRTGWDHAAAILRKDYERWSRFGLGFGAYLAVCLGLLMVATAFELWSEMRAAAQSTEGLDDLVIGGIFGLGIAGSGAYVMFRLWRSGRKLSRAAAAWLRAPYSMGLRRPTSGGWWDPRAVNYEVRISARLVATSLAGLMTVAGVSVGIANPIDEPITAAGFGLVGVFSGMCTFGQFGGVMHIVNGLAVRDSLWMSLRNTFSRR